MVNEEGCAVTEAEETRGGREGNGEEWGHMELPT